MVIQLFPVTEALSRHLSRLAKTVYTVQKNRKKSPDRWPKTILFYSFMKGVTSLGLEKKTKKTPSEMEVACLLSLHCLHFLHY